MIEEIERRQHQLHATLPSFGRKVDWTKQIIEDAFDKTKRPYLAFSGGIDSTVLLDLVYQIKTCPVLWGDDGWDYPETLTFLRETEARYGFQLRRIRCMQPWRDWCSEMDRPDLAADPESREVWGNPHEWDDSWQLLNDACFHGYDGVFLGLLARESRARGYALQGGHRPLYQVKAEQGMWHCSPLAAWTKRDIWAYVVSRELAYNPIYNREASLGVLLERRRVAPLTCFRVLQYGSAVQFRQIDPALWNRMTAIFPHMRASS